MPLGTAVTAACRQGRRLRATLPAPKLIIEAAADIYRYCLLLFYQRAGHRYKMLEVMNASLDAMP